MKKILVFVLGLVSPLLVNAANVLIWEFDTLDVFYDSEISRTVDCPYWLGQALGAGGHTYTATTALPADLSPYQVVFVTLGWFRC